MQLEHKSSTGDRCELGEIVGWAQHRRVPPPEFQPALGGTRLCSAHPTLAPKTGRAKASGSTPVGDEATKLFKI